jgi:dihydrofolate reductase
MITIIAAIDLDRCLGKEGKIPWHLPSDLQRFRTLTMEHTVIMGRKTYESLPDEFRPLPKRFNIILSRNLPRRADAKVAIVRSIDEALATARGEVDIIGGAQIYQQALPLVDRIYLTEVQTTIDNGDVFFPSIDNWHLIECSTIAKPEGDEFASRLLVYRQ